MTSGLATGSRCGPCGLFRWARIRQAAHHSEAWQSGAIAAHDLGFLRTQFTARARMPARFVCRIFVAALILLRACAPGLTGEPLFRLDVSGHTVEGTPLALSDQKV